MVNSKCMQCATGGAYELVSTEEWEEEQKRMDRQWYSMDEGYDESQNPFSGLSDEYTKRKEQELEQKRKKKISARQRQIQKVLFVVLSCFLEVIVGDLLVCCIFQETVFMLGTGNSSLFFLNKYLIISYLNLQKDLCGE